MLVSNVIKSELSLVFRLLQYSVGAVVVGTMAVTLTISFAALIYTGPLAPLLGQGASLVLFGAAVMAAVGAFSYSLPGSIANPQDASAVVLGSAAIGLVSTHSVAPEALFPTIIGLTMAAGLVAGVCAFLAGVLRMGALVRYAPYPVTSGFLAATGYLLVTGALSIVTRESVTVFNFTVVLANLPVSYWLPWIAAGLALVVITNRLPGDFTLPVAVFLATVIFYAVLALKGISIETALARGMLLGPFNATDVRSILDWQFLGKIEWAEIFYAAPTLAAVTGLTLLGSLLNSTGLSIVVQEPVDTEREMRATGLVNLLSAPLGSLPGYTILGESILARRLGLVGYAPGLVVAFACGMAAFAGIEYLAYAPAGLMAIVVSYLGFDLLNSWLIASRTRMSAYEYIVVLLILLVTATFGFLEALALGTLAAAVIFVITYAKTDVVNLRYDLAQRQSWVERPEEELAQLRTAGHVCVVLELSGFLFFGTADKITRLAIAETEADSELRYLILDFGRVTGLDASASASLIEVVRLSRSAGVEITFCSISSELKRQIQLVVPERERPRINGSIEAELERVEDILLEEAFASEPRRIPHILEVAQALEKEFAESPDIIRRISLREGQVLLARGSNSREIYVLSSGQLRAEVPTTDGRQKAVAKLRAGALIGEIAYYANVPRSASVVAETACEVVYIDLGRLDGSLSSNVLEFEQACAECLARRIMRMTGQLSDPDLPPD
ncbi:SulP family inorganic anion transporter [Aestuariicoccus sp. MJ-SS9]|uniref:SulP family inorganic anion transporter n=1 Tax=Aestuariicoccus sp. MJ-SS9 TaxID=3079855 RepID=UPI00292D714A|nr:SulP family inorganic anion transporter [Aestuariicoccus sp. MJ-SS9]